MKFKGPSKNDIVAGSIIFVLIMLAIEFSDIESLNTPSHNKELFTPILRKTSKGIVTHKYRDKAEHNNRTIELIINDSLERYYVFHWSDDIIYNYINISDSIIATDYGSQLIIRRKNKDSVFHLK